MATRREFMESVNDFDDLVSFCNEVGSYDTVEYLYTDSARDEYINDDLSNYWSSEGWEEVRDYLDSLEASGSYEWWYRDEWDGDWRGLCYSDIDEWKTQVADELEENGYFDSEDEEDNEELSVVETEDEDDDCEGEFEFEDFEFDSGTVIVWNEPEPAPEPAPEAQAAPSVANEDECTPMLSSASDLTMLWG